MGRKKSVQDKIAAIESGIVPQYAESESGNGGGPVIVEKIGPHPDLERIEDLLKDRVEELQTKEAEFAAYIAEMQAVIDQKKKEVEESASGIRTRIVELVGIQKYLNSDI